MISLKDRPTIQEEDPRLTWTRRTGMLVAAVTPVPDGGGVELRYAACGQCSTPLRADGTCNPCTHFSRPDPDLGDDDPRYRLDFLGPEDGHTLADAERDRAALHAAARRRALREYDAATPINGCAECGRLPEQHGKVYGHTWDAPTDRLRLARLRARREMKAQR